MRSLPVHGGVVEGNAGPALLHPRRRSLRGSGSGIAVPPLLQVDGVHILHEQNKQNMLIIIQVTHILQIDRYSTVFAQGDRNIRPRAIHYG